MDEEDIDDLGLEILENLLDDEKMRAAWDEQINHYLLSAHPGCSKGFFVNKDADLQRFADLRTKLFHWVKMRPKQRQCFPSLKYLWLLI